MADIHLSTGDGVATLTLDNGAANALTGGMLAKLRDLLDRLDADEDVGAVVIAARTGGAFCAGSDIGELRDLHEKGEGPMALLDLENAAFDRLAAMETPTLAAVEGAATGGGMELVLACDLVVAGPNARFALPEIKLGVFPGAGGTLRAPLRIGYARALEMMLLGDDIDARAALDWGLVNRIAQEGGALDAAQKLGRRLAHGPRAAQARLKQALKATYAMEEAEAKALVRRFSEQLGRGPDIAEGMRAFFARERPTFNRKG